ncbi:D-2-hydroxyacid dehydrogenase [Flammeovirga pacifica]|uniref:Hydroxyacid dehydrogenase n=1 Tax=Flammeovirga pacifica TaxID=915059 RepID=A0A1S1YY84_FLAPC|nr:D-2-hydroxyacid dehydrogenase [Flammeovirga pacifica]OHX65974.1 hydroxyacid dehydrogenase [Flammeovirga pacifica]
MQIVFLDAETLGNDVQTELQQFDQLGEVIHYPLTPKESTLSRIKEADVIVTNKVVITKEMMKACTQLKGIAITATGTNNVDLEAAKALNIPVKNAVGYSSESVAQQTFAMLLSLMNNIHEYDEFVKDDSYSNHPSFTWIGKGFQEIHGKTFGIIGLGNIGKRVAEIATAFGANVIYYSTSGIARDERFTLVDKETLFQTSDIISIHSPLNDATKNIVSVEELKMMKPSSILLNTGRGGIVDESALVDALNENQIAGTCVDVFTVEPMVQESPFKDVKDQSKILYSPHIAWASLEARRKLLNITLENVKSFLNS